MQIFVTYSQEDQHIALTITKQLAATGARAWLDIHDAPADDEATWEAAIETALNESDILLVLLSPDAIEDPYVTSDLQRYIEAGRLVVVAIVRPCDHIPELLNNRNPVDLTHATSLASAMHRLTTVLLEKASRLSSKTPLQAALSDGLRYQRRVGKS